MADRLPLNSFENTGHITGRQADCQTDWSAKSQGKEIGYEEERGLGNK